MKYKFLRPQDPYSLDDFESKITELAMKVDRDFGSLSNAARSATNLLERSSQNLSGTETADFVKLISHFQYLADLADTHEAEYLDIQAELNSYITGNFTFDENSRQLIYLDHKNFENKYPKFNAHGILQK